MKYPFTKATLHYGAVSRVQVLDNAELAPIGEFDTEKDLMEEAFRVMAVMSHAAGGHKLARAALHVNQTFVQLMGDGFDVLWGWRQQPHPECSAKEIAEFIMKDLDRTEMHIVPFGVLATQYGRGWEQAIKC